MPRYSVLGMETAGVLTAAEAHADAASNAVRAVINAEYLRFTDAELLSFAQTFETTARLVFTAQVRIAGEIDARNIADRPRRTSTGALLRQTLTISPADARTRVNTAKATLPQQAVSGGTLDPVLPLLGAALADGEIGVEQTRTIVATMTKLPAAVTRSSATTCRTPWSNTASSPNPNRSRTSPGRSRRPATRTAT